MKSVIIITAFCMFINLQSYSQGCIIVRDNADHPDTLYLANPSWGLGIFNSYFHSFRDFSGSDNIHTPKQNENEIISFSSDISLNRVLKNGWSVVFDLPIRSNARTTNSEHGGPNTPRYTTHSVGVGDVTFEVYKWLLRSDGSQKFNVQIGLGLKLPTGDYRYQDYFHKTDSTVILAPVAQAIQLGDGGTGIITGLNMFYIVNKKFNIYGNFTYLMNPRDVNGVPNPANGAINSVIDGYSIRAGFYYNMKKITLTAGVLDGGVPAHDLLGKSDGFRRAGHNISVEPGFIYHMKKLSLYTYVPIEFDHKIISPGYGGSGNYELFAGATFMLDENKQ